MSSLHPAFLPGILGRLPESPRRIVVVRASRIGDFICATPAFRALRAALPGARITLVALPFLDDLARKSLLFDDFVHFVGFPGLAEQFFDARKATAFFTRMQAERFDLAIQMHGTGVYSNPFTLLLGATSTVGMIRRTDRPGRLDGAMFAPARGHEVRRLLSFTTFLGAPSRGEETLFPLSPEDNAAAEGLLASLERPLIGVHPFARDAEKCWPLDHFVEVAQQLRNRYGGTIVLVGGTDNRIAAAAMAEAIGTGCADLTGRTSISSLGAVVARMAVLISNDSAPAHVAYALGTPAVTVFIDTDPTRWGPPGEGPFRIVSLAGMMGVERGRRGQGPGRGNGVDEVVRAAEEVIHP